MNFTKEEVLTYVNEEDVKFIRLAFCDVFGHQKNLSIMPEELPRAFEYGISFDPSSVAGFAQETCSDLLLHPDPGTLAWLPWRPEQGKVIRMYCTITYPDGSPFTCDTRSLLIRAVRDAEKAGLSFYFGTKQEFYLFYLDEHGMPTKIPYDHAGYMDIAPEDKGENIRREIILNLEQMGIRPESSRHEAGPGQNTINFRYSDPLCAADDALTFQTVVKTVAGRNGLCADFSAKPLPDQPGNGFHITISAENSDPSDPAGILRPAAAGILDKAREMSVFLNPCDDSYRRLGYFKAPKQVSWSHEHRAPLMRVPPIGIGNPRIELRSPDPQANPYLAFALLIYAGLYGISKDMPLPEPVEEKPALLQLPSDLGSAKETAHSSEFIQAHIPQSILKAYC